MNVWTEPRGAGEPAPRPGHLPDGAEAARPASPLLSVERAPRPSARELRDAARTFARYAGRRARPNDLDARDPAFIAGVRPFMDALYDGYFRCETELEQEIPSGGVLLVANHNGMTGTPDMFCHMAAFWRRYGHGRVAYGLMHDVPFGLPAAGAWFNAAGAIAASPENGRRALARDAAVLVFPGGDVDACKPFRDRYRVDFGERRGFIRLALRSRVPIVPIVSVGGHESLYLLSDGRWLADKLRLRSFLRTNVAPLGFALPYGLVAGVAAPHLPPPVKIHTRIGAPIESGLPADAADDPAEVERLYVRVMRSMRRSMNELRAAGRHGLFPRRASSAGAGRAHAAPGPAAPIPAPSVQAGSVQAGWAREARP